MCIPSPPLQIPLTEQLELLYGDDKQQALIVGNFIAHEEEWLKSTTTDAGGRASYMRVCDLEVCSRPTRTRGEVILDLVIGLYQGRIELPKAARGHATFVDGKMLNIEFKF